MLFGSVAQGDPVREFSDLDLVIVKETDRRFYDRLKDVIQLVRPRVGVDILVYTPAEWASLQERSHFVRTEIAGKGRELYAA